MPKTDYSVAVSTFKKEEFGSAGFISRLRGLQYEGGSLYASDSENGRILRLDENLEVLHQLGSQGNGPGEFRGAGWFHVADGLVIAQNEGPQQIYFFDETGGFERMFSVPGLVIQTRFTFYRGELYLSTPQQASPISVLDLDGNYLRGFGSFFDTEHLKQRTARSYQHLSKVMLAEREYLVAVWETEPRIDLYDYDGTLVVSQRFDNHRSLVPRLEFRDKVYAENPESRGTSYILFQDVETDGDLVYALVYSGNPTSDIVVFHLTPQKIEEKRVIRIPTSIDRFTLCHKSIYGSAWANREIHRFEIESEK